MKAKLFQNKIYVKQSAVHGYGVFAGKTIKKDEIVEECHGLPVTEKKNTVLEDYVFQTSNGSYIFLGYGSIYNHSDQPNVDYAFENDIMHIVARRTIYKGEEILLDYGPYWFSQRNLKHKESQRHWGLINPMTTMLVRIGVVCSGLYLLVHSVTHYHTELITLASRF